MKRIVYVLPLFLLAIGSVCAQSTVELDPVTVTAALTPVNVSASGRNIVVIKGEQLTNMPAHSLDEILRYLPGIEVQSRGPAGAQSDIVIRGGTFQQVLVMIDGLRLNDPVTGHFNAYIPITTSEIDRIEILKGAGSAVYGTEAVGGVINIITKTFSAKKGAKLTQGLVDMTHGAYGLWDLNAGLNWQQDHTAVGIGLLTNNTDGQDLRGIRGYLHSTAVSLSAKQFFQHNWSLGLRTVYDNRRFAAQNFYTTFSSDTATEKVITSWSQLQLKWQGQKGSFTLNAGYKTGSDNYLYNNSSLANENYSKKWQAAALYEHKSSATTSWVGGLQFERNSITSNDRGDHAVSTIAGFLVGNQKFFNALSVDPALRLEYNEIAGWELVPQLNVSWNKNHWQLRGSVGKTTRDADFTERYNNYNKTLVTGGSIGNPDLTAEHSFNAEIGADYIVSKRLKLSTSLFSMDQHNLIDYVPTPYADMPRKDNLIPAGSYSLSKNIADVTTQGWELDILYSHTQRTQGLFLTTGVVWLYSKSSEPVPSFYILSHARFLLSYQLQYNYRQLGLVLSGLYKTRQAQQAPAIGQEIGSDYYVMNLQGQYRLLHERITLFLEADNLLDRHYSDLLGAQMPGVWVSGGLKIKW